MRESEYSGTLVVGGGPAGAAAAIWLARAGNPVTLWEKERRPLHRTCGDFLGWEAVAYLKDLGIEPASLGAAPIEHFRLITAAQKAEVPLGFKAFAITRRQLDDALLQRAEACGVTVMRGMGARELKSDGHVMEGVDSLRPRHLFWAVGRQPAKGVAPVALENSRKLPGYKSYFRLSPEQRSALAGASELYLCHGGYVRLRLVERDMANLYFRVTPKRWNHSGGDFETLLAQLGHEVPALGKRLAGSVNLLDRPLLLGEEEGNYIHRPATTDTNAPWRLGEQAVRVPDLAGAGIGLALHSAKLATGALMTGAGKAGYYQQLRADTRWALSHAQWMGRLLEKPEWGTVVSMMARWLPSSLHMVSGAGGLTKKAVSKAMRT